ncbi:hypothetical protein D3C81_1643310 [compost metagenome]
MLAGGVAAVDHLLGRTCFAPDPVAVHKGIAACAQGHHLLQGFPDLLGGFGTDNLPDHLRLRRFHHLPRNRVIPAFGDVGLIQLASVHRR